jgi:hypothetical protein
LKQKKKGDSFSANLESVKKLTKRDRHVATLLAMTYQKAVLCVIAVKMTFMSVKRQPLCHRERVARGDLKGLTAKRLL